jgi:acetylornithine/succinyldiaminopimelate/putrescine aminotransferase
MDHLQQSFFDFLAPTSAEPLALTVTKAEGLYLFDEEGKRYMDLISGLAVNNIGHRHPHVIHAIQEQIDRYLHVIPYGEFVQEPQVKLAKKLAAILPNSLSCSYFVNSGTEANEAALKLAKRATGRTEIVSCKAAYHGSTHGSMSVTGNETKKYAFRPLLPDVHFIDFNVIEDLTKITKKTAAVIIEPIQGDAGVRIPSSAYMKALRERCNATGTLLIFDEVQTGFGRTGKWFAFQHFGIVPDIMTLAKAMGGGMPIGAFIASKELMDCLKSDPMLGHITTFGGHPVNCAAALANIEVLENEKLVEQVAEKEALFRERLKHPLIHEIRSVGLFFAIEMANFETVHKAVLKCMENGLIAFWFLSCKNSFRLAPPLTITKEEIEEACKLILKSLDEIS